MIDISNVVLRKVKDAVTAVYQTADILSYDPDSITSYPCVSVVERDNYTYERSLDGVGAEYHANVVFEINVYTNATDGKRTQAKEIIKLIDDVMLSNKFMREMLNPLPNIDRSVYRMYARYKAIVGADETDGNGNTINRIYRR